jgi:hypothetical protein
MKFHLNYSPQRAGFEIDHSHRLLLAGSCFSSEIGALLNDHRFRVCVNPDGVLFNPASICNSLDQALHLRPYDRSAVLTRDGVYLSYLHHSSIHAGSEADLLRKIDAAAQRAQDFLWSAQVIVITFGTAFVYARRDSGMIVANCHRQSSSGFEKRLLLNEEIVAMYEGLLTALKNVNPGIQIIFTVSPVKHLGDGLEGNSISKATLLLAAHELVRRNADCHYFPAYELVTDDLRDYRFYREDLAHPNDQAIRFVWDKFGQCYFSAATLALNVQIEKLNDAMKHRPLHDEGNEKWQEYIRRQRNEVVRMNPSVEI